MAELCRRPMVYRAIILSLQSIFREELVIISAIKARLPNVEIWLSHTDGRQALLRESIRLGADGIVSDDGLHRLGVETAPPAGPAIHPHDDHEASVPYAPGGFASVDDPMGNEPVLTAEELRALLQEQPIFRPGDE